MYEWIDIREPADFAELTKRLDADFEAPRVVRILQEGINSSVAGVLTTLRALLPGSEAILMLIPPQHDPLTRCTSREQQRPLKQMHADLVALDYQGSYNRVAAFSRAWKARRKRAGTAS